MVIAWWASVAWASSPVVCDPMIAQATLAEADIDPERAPVSHPELLPGLVLAQDEVEPALHGALSLMCGDEAPLTVVATDRWDDPGWAAHTFVLTRRDGKDCFIEQSGAAISVRVAPGREPRYALLTTLPTTLTPQSSCDQPPSWSQETVLAGENTPTRLLLTESFVGDERVGSALRVRRASELGWTEFILADPAPPRSLGGREGPQVTLTPRAGTQWVVFHGQRIFEGDVCHPVLGQTVWTPDGETWNAHTGRDALGLLAAEGGTRLAGQDGWLLIVAQDDEEDAEILNERLVGWQSRVDEPLLLLSSASLPLLNPGFLVIATVPYPSQEEALAGRSALRRGGARIRQGWAAVNPCQED